MKVAKGLFLAGRTLVVGCLVAAPARGEDGFANQLFEPVPAQGRAILGVGTSYSLVQGEFSAGFFVHYEDDPMTLVDPDDHSSVIARLIDTRLTAEILGAVGLVDWLEVGLALPIVLSQSGDDLAPLGRPGETVGGAVGDLRLIPKFTIFGGAQGFGLHLSLVVSLPTGDSAQFVGDGGVRVRPVLGVDYAAGGYRVALEAGYEIRAERQASTYVSDDMIRWGLAGRVPLAPELLSLLVAAQGTVQTAAGIDPNDPSKALNDAPNTSIEAMGALELTVADGVVLTAGGGATFVYAVGSPDVRGFFGAAWTSPGGVASDDDGDGLVGGDDDCPEAAEDKDGFQDGDGCPDRDDDKDGVLDTADGCRLEPEDIDGVEDGDGCPDPDDDRDGLVDGDKCPREAEDKDGFQDQDGCPDLDNDGDGIADVSDKCPDAPEDKDGFDDSDGCPDPDNDGDGIADGADKCPDRPEVMNGVDDSDGCPDTAEKGIELTASEIRIAGKINFPRDSDQINADSFTLIDSLAKVMSEHPYLTKVRVEGHTDSEGVDTINLELSRRRAAAVAAYLVTKGIAPARLVSQGYGESRPLMKNDTPNGRAKNRRVEFKIVEVNGLEVHDALPTP